MVYILRYIAYCGDFLDRFPLKVHRSSQLKAFFDNLDLLLEFEYTLHLII